ncbi:hypothetical protein [Mahella sp.]|uniref:hypothetical protein n=1 Tax=Mahella sp. TaxID=2798721 RepID=UPI0025B9CFB6|nr:hypothetical protein [Mahella sp.]MBZ4665123.1 hypothetical protein [Mahella sp.]
MLALFIVLNRTEYLKDVLKAVEDMGLSCTVIDSISANQYINFYSPNTFASYNVPVVVGSMSMADDDSGIIYNKTLIMLVEDEEKAQQAMETVESVVGDMARPGTGIMFYVPVVKAVGK